MKQVAWIPIALAGCILAATLGCSSMSGLDAETAEKLREIRNLGKAFYENPGSSQEAVDTLAQALTLVPDSAVDQLNYSLALLRAGQMEEGIAGLEKAQEMDPEIPHSYFNLGVEYKKMGEAEKAITQFEKMIELTPNEAKAHYNLGQLYKQLDRNEDARAKFELAAELDPSLGAPHFQLYNLLRREDREAARAELEAFQRIKKLQDETGLDEDVDWSYYSELYDPVADETPIADEVALSFEAEQVGDGARGVLVADLDADGQPDPIFWAGQSVTIRSAAGETTSSFAAEVRGVDAGDPDNDGSADLCVATAAGAELVPASGEARSLAEGDFESCLFHDFDHDNDADIVLLGAPNLLLRNNGAETLEFEPVEFPFAQQRGLAAAAVELFEDNGIDLIVAYEGSVVVYQDRKLGRYDAEEPLAGVTPGDAPVQIEAVDIDSDALFEIAITSAGGETQILENDHGALSAGDTIDRAPTFGDFGNRGIWAALPAAADGLPANVSFAAAADFNADGKADVLSLNAEGQVHLSTNTTAADNAWASIRLTGVKSAKLSKGARVEVKAGRLYQKQIYDGYPLHFGLNGQDKIETVRITWTNGMIQNELQLGINEAFDWEEKPRLSGSCPMIFTWNGEEFEYISEVLGVAPLGASMGNGQFFPVDHDEYVFLGADQLVERDGYYDVRITEELREVAYIDQVRLLVIDRPSDVDVYTNEKFKAPPFPEFALYGVREEQKVRPAVATNHRGDDVAAKLSARDGDYVDQFERTFRNTAEQHWVTVDLAGLEGKDRSRLFLTGWVDWADASTIVNRAQTGSLGIAPPVLQVRDQTGEWQTVIDNFGLPGGRPRTMSVDLTGKFLSDSREVRILTNMCVYWDEIFAADGVTAPEISRLDLDPEEAELRFHGFSENQTHPQRLEPENFIYGKIRPASTWNPTPGRYTGFGDVRSLLAKIDDRLVVMGAGDEIRMRFAAPTPPQDGRTREFLLFVDGWAKENEPNTAFGDTVEPLPFHDMSQYPYPLSEQGPHPKWADEQLTRPALRLIRPLNEQVVR